MVDWFLETGLYLLTVAILPAAGVLLIYCGLFGDRSRGRARCPACWHDMRASLPGLVCPKCGRDAGWEGSLYRNRRRWWLVVPGVIAVLLTLFIVYESIVGPQDFRDWIDGAKYPLGIMLVPTAGLLFVAWGLWGDRSKARSRCPKCWYDMRGSLPRLECPECGHDARSKRRLYRNRPIRQLIAVGVLLLLLSIYPLSVMGGWCRDRVAVWWHRLDSADFETVGPAWLVDRLPEELARFFDRCDYLRVDEPAQLAALRCLPHVRTIWLDRTPVADGDLVHVKGLSNLEDLGLQNTHVTDAGLVHLERMTNLEGLYLADTAVTDAGLIQLKGLMSLRRLWLGNTQVTGAGLVHLEGLPNLERLFLEGPRMTDAGLVHVKGWLSLKRLALDDTQVTDAGLVHLEGLLNLVCLYMQNTQVTDAGLIHLSGLSKLSYLDVRKTQVTDAGVAKLKQALPRLNVDWE